MLVRVLLAVANDPLRRRIARLARQRTVLVRELEEGEGLLERLERESCDLAVVSRPLLSDPRQPPCRWNRLRKARSRMHEVTVLGYVLFQSTQAATRAETVLRRRGLAVRLVTTPRHLSSECGTALSFGVEDGLTERVKQELCGAGVPFVAIHVLTEQPIKPGKEGKVDRRDMIRLTALASCAG